MAIQLSLFFDSIYNFVTTSPKSQDLRLNISQISDRGLSEIWNGLHLKYFPENQELHKYKICWSNRHQTNCLASINITKKIVRVAPAMKLIEASPFLEALIYHEMCHVIIGIKIVAGRRKMHTKEFKLLESHHPGIKLLDTWIKDGGWVSAVRKSKKLNNKTKLNNF